MEIITFLDSKGLVFTGNHNHISSIQNKHILGKNELLAKFDPFMGS